MSAISSCTFEQISSASSRAAAGNCNLTPAVSKDMSDKTQLKILKIFMRFTDENLAVLKSSLRLSLPINQNQHGTPLIDIKPENGTSTNKL